MKHSLILMVAALSLVFAACSDNKTDDTQQNKSALCLSFVDQAIESYAMTWWDTNKDYCIDSDEAAAVTQIPAMAFVNNTQILSLDDLNQFPNLTSIGNGAFSGCTNLASANVPNVTIIGDSAFAGCTGLTTVNAPNATSIGNGAFSGCSNLVTVNVPAQNPPTAQCTDGVRKCSDSGLQVLLCMHNAWAILENCSSGCKDNACITNIPQPVCTEGALKCSDAGDRVVSCKNNHWEFKESCSYGCTDGVCNTKPEVICPDKCKDNCDDNGLCNDIVIPTCPSTCKNGCDDTGNCKPDEVTCPSTCKNGCDDAGNCKPDEVTCPSTCKNGCNPDGTCACPSTCKNGCDAAGNCKSNDVTCPSTCINGCDPDGTCACPSSCKNGCDDAGNCKPDEFICPSTCQNGCDPDGTCACPSTCINGCDDAGNCKPDEITCPSTCQNGCDPDGTCACPSTCINGCDDVGKCIQSSSCPTDFPKDGSWFDCGGCQFDNFIKCIRDHEDGDYDYWDMFVYKDNLVDYDAWCIADHANKYQFDNICEDKPILDKSLTLAEYCQPGNTVLCRWEDNQIHAECFTPCSASEVGNVVLSYHDGGDSGACFLYLNDNYYAELGIYGYKCSNKNGHYVYMEDSHFYQSDEGDCGLCNEKYSYEVCKKYCDYYEYCYPFYTGYMSEPCMTDCSIESNAFFVGNHEICNQGDVKTGNELFANVSNYYIQPLLHYADIVKDYTYRCNSDGEWEIYEGDTNLCH